MLRFRLLLLSAFLAAFLGGSALLPAQPSDLAAAEAEAQAATPYKAAEIMQLPPTKLAELLADSAASDFAKAKACQRLSVVGGRKSVPALAALLSDPSLSHYARTALETIDDPASDVALVQSLESLEGDLLIGVINSIGRRRYPGSLDALANLRHDEDQRVADAASAALGRLRGP